jgi:hypothetical protein
LTLLGITIFAIIFIISAVSLRVHSLPLSPYFTYVNVTKSPINSTASFGSYFLALANGKVFIVKENNVESLPYGRPINYLRQACSSPFALSGIDGAALYVAGTKEVGVIIGRNGILNIKGFSTYTTPIIPSLGYDCKNNILWVVDKNGNLYISSPSWREVIVIGPNGPKNESLLMDIVHEMNSTAPSEIIEYLKKQHPDAAAITLIKYTYANLTRIVRAGKTYRVSTGLWYMDSSFLPVNVVSKFTYEAQIMLSDGTTFTVEGEFNASALIILNLINFNVVKVYPNINGDVIISSSLNRNYGMLLSILNKNLNKEVKFYRLQGTYVKNVFNVSLKNVQDVIPIYDSELGLPAVVVNDGKDIMYYVAKNNNEWLTWSLEPFRGKEVEEIFPWKAYIVVISPHAINLLSAENGTPLWVFLDGVEVDKVKVTSVSAGNVLAIGLGNGRLLVVPEPVILSKVKIYVTLNNRSLGSGLPITFKASKISFQAFTKNGTAIVYLPRGLWTVSTYNPLLGPLEENLNVTEPVQSLKLNYEVVNSFYFILKGRDPLGFLKEVPAEGVKAYLLTSWNTTIDLTTLSNGMLVPLDVPKYLDGLFQGLPLRVGKTYIIKVLPPSGYQGLETKIVPGNGTLILRPLLSKIVLTTLDNYDKRPIMAILTITGYNHTAKVIVNGTKSILLPQGIYKIIITSKYYYSVEDTLNVSTLSLRLTYVLERTKTALTLIILDEDLKVPVNATAYLKGPTKITYFIINGRARLNVPWGTYALKVTAPSYLNLTTEITVPPNEEVIKVLYIKPVTFSILIKVEDYYDLSPISFSAFLYINSPGLGKVLYKIVKGKGEVWLKVREQNPFIVISANGYYNYTLVPSRNKLYYLILLKRVEYNLTLAVFDQELGRPVTARIRLEGPTSLNVSSSLLRAELPWGTYKLYITSPGYEEFKTTITIPSTRPLIVALRPLRYKLTIVARDSYTGRPVNFSVRATPAPPYLPVSARGFGKLTLELRSGILYNLVITAKGYLPITSTINLTSNKIIYVDLLRRSLPLKIVVRDAETGTPIANASVSIYSPLFLTRIKGITDSNGTYRALLVWGTYQVEVKKRGYLLFKLNVNLTPYNLRSGLVLVNMIPITHLLELRVLDSERNTTVSNVSVLIKNLKLGFTYNFSSSIISVYLREGIYSIIVKAPGYSSYKGLVNLSKNMKLNMYLRPLRRNVIVSAIDSKTGAPLPFTVRIFISNGSLIKTLHSEGQPISISLRVGNYTLEILSPLHLPYKTRLSVKTGTSPIEVTARLEEIRVPIKIVVINEKGRVVNAFLEIKGPNTTIRVISNTTIELPVGHTYVIRAWASGYLPTFKEVYVQKPGTVLIMLSSRKILSRLYLPLVTLIAVAIIAGAFWSWIRRKEERELEEHLRRIIEGGS